MHRRRTLWVRIIKYLEMPHLNRRDRNQRVAIAGVVMFMVVYLLVLRPLIDIMFPASQSKQTKSAPASGSTGIANKKR